MEQQDSERLARCLLAASEIYSKEVSIAAARIWNQALKHYDIVAIETAFSRHMRDPDSGRFMPKPADIIRMIVGTHQEAALAAWTKVETAIRRCGWRGSVVFDDPLIHQTMEDMGGFASFGRRQERDWPFIGKEFRERYVMHRASGEIGEYPRIMHFGSGQEEHDPTVIGDHRKAKAVADGNLTGFAFTPKTIGISATEFDSNSRQFEDENRCLPKPEAITQMFKQP